MDRAVRFLECPFCGQITATDDVGDVYCGIHWDRDWLRVTCGTMRMIPVSPEREQELRRKHSEEWRRRFNKPMIAGTGDEE